MQTKLCACCKKDKGFSLFYPNCNTCKICIKAQREAVKEHKRAWVREHDMSIPFVL